jgi:hypothetical protein
MGFDLTLEVRFEMRWEVGTEIGKRNREKPCERRRRADIYWVGYLGYSRGLPE